MIHQERQSNLAGCPLTGSCPASTAALDPETAADIDGHLWPIGARHHSQGSVMTISV
jgi:hypothetical protein